MPQDLSFQVRREAEVARPLTCTAPTHLHGRQAGAALGDLPGIAVRGLLDLEQPGCLGEGLQRLLG